MKGRYLNPRESTPDGFIPPLLRQLFQLTPGPVPAYLHITPTQGGIKYFASWQRVVFINYFRKDNANCGNLYDPQHTFNATKFWFLPYKVPLEDV